MAGDRADVHELPPPRSTLQARYVAVLVSCRSCLRSQHADLDALIDAGRGDVPLIDLRWHCARCGHLRIDMVSRARKLLPW